MKINWPEYLGDITCVGFSESLIDILAEAIDNDHVKWVTRKSSANTSDGRYSEFDYLGFRYSLDELYEPITNAEGEETGWDFVPVRVKKIAKVDVAGNGDTIIVEKYPLVIEKPKPTPRSADWGSF